MSLAVIFSFYFSPLLHHKTFLYHYSVTFLCISLTITAFPLSLLPPVLSPIPFIIHSSSVTARSEVGTHLGHQSFFLFIYSPLSAACIFFSPLCDKLYLKFCCCFSSFLRFIPQWTRTMQNSLFLNNN